MVLVQYAYTESGEILPADRLTKAHRKQSFSCGRCGEPLIARVGGVNVPHFAHVRDSGCGGESDLHKLAKHLFAHEFTTRSEEGRPFEIEYELELYCDRLRHRLEYRRSVKGWLNLTEHYHTAIVEGAYPESANPPKRADVLLLSDTKPCLAIEIFHTHAVEDGTAKLGVPIVQIPVHDDEDLALLRSGRLSIWKVAQFNIPERRRLRRCVCMTGTDEEVQALDEEMRALTPPKAKPQKKKPKPKRGKRRYSRAKRAWYAYLRGWVDDDFYDKLDIDGKIGDRP